MSLNDEIKNMLSENGFPLFGVGDMKDVKNCEYRYAISFVLPVPKEIVKTIKRIGPTKEYMEVYKDMNSKLNDMMLKIEKYLKDKGYDAFAYTGDYSTYDEITWETKLPHKTAATRAGLGWIGKCDLLITEEYGGAIRLGTVYTNADLIPNAPINESKCGNCTICVDICPAKAITGKNWDVSIHRNELVDPKTCNYNMIEQMRKAASIDYEICGRCFAHCIYTKNYIE